MQKFHFSGERDNYYVSKLECDVFNFTKMNLVEKMLKKITS